MYAVVKTGGKQYRVAAGEKIKVEQIAANIGQEVTLSEVLAVGSGSDLTLGTPLVAGAAVTAQVLQHGRGEKVRIFKMRRRKHYQKRQGHRQNFTELLISNIVLGGKSLAQVDAAAAAGSFPIAKQAQKKGQDNLEIIEGIGPKIAGLFVAAGISTFAQLAATPVEKMKEILHAAGNRYNMADPSTWAEQSALAASGEWGTLTKLQDELDAGKRA